MKTDRYLPCAYSEQLTTSCGENVTCRELFVAILNLDSSIPIDEKAKQLPQEPETKFDIIKKYNAFSRQIPICFIQNNFSHPFQSQLNMNSTSGI